MVPAEENFDLPRGSSLGRTHEGRLVPMFSGPHPKVCRYGLRRPIVVMNNCAE